MGRQKRILDGNGALIMGMVERGVPTEKIMQMFGVSRHTVNRFKQFHKYEVIRQGWIKEEEESFKNTCRICGSPCHTELCDACFSDYADDYDASFKLGKKCAKESVELNPFITDNFTADDIERILLEYAKENYVENKFATGDIEWYEEQIIKQNIESMRTHK